MRDVSQRRTLLGRLAGQGWFAKRGEVAATAGLAFLLEEEPLRVAVLSHLANRTGLDVAGVTQFVPEAVQEDLGRPDLEGRDDAGFPLLKIEAKFAAALDRNQLLAFMDDQKRRLGEHGSGAFVVLMPSHRKPEAQALLDSVGAPAAQASPKVATYVMTWDELFEVLDEAAASTASASSDAIASDLLQLRDLCQTLQGLDIRPLGEAASGRDWEQRRTDLERIVERVTEQLSRGDKLLPTGKDSLYTYRRYINTGADSYSAIGIVAEFTIFGSPLWLRYHSKTPGFKEISQRLESSSHNDRARHEHGHIWLPLNVPQDLSGAGIVAVLVEQVKNINKDLTNA